MKKAVLGVVLLSSLVGCVATAPPAISRVAFPENEYAAITERNRTSPATATVKGQAFLKTRGGDVKVAAGEEVRLNPVTSYSTQWFNNVMSSTPTSLSEPDIRYSGYIKVKLADGSGRFEFKKVPAGEYYVSTKVSWETPTGYAGAMQAQGAWLAKRISVTDGEEVEIILTR